METKESIRAESKAMSIQTVLAVVITAICVVLFEYGKGAGDTNTKVIVTLAIVMLALGGSILGIVFAERYVHSKKENISQSA
jgi:heme/copper-type cytochrome/quinol oxidase subunit 4